MKVFGIVFCFLCVSFLEASETYRAGVLHLDKEFTNADAHFVYDAGISDVDILVLSSSETAETVNNYYEIVKSLSEAAEQAGLYLVANLNENVHCQNNIEEVKTNLVFDREGSLISIKPVSNMVNCTSVPSELMTFTTDFGVTFGLLMEEDIVLHDVEYMKGLKNFVMAGASNGKYLSAPQFASSWTYITNANLISSSGIFSGKSGLKTAPGRLAVADLNKNGESENLAVPSVGPLGCSSCEDLSLYVIKPLDLEASTQGYRETVCHKSFCCEFYVKTGVTGTKSEMSYGLAAFDGVRSYSDNHNIGTQDCTVIACAGSLKSTGVNTTNVVFENISVSANFTKKNVQYPMVQSSSEMSTEKFKFETKTNELSTQVTLETIDGQNLHRFGILGRDFDKDFETFAQQRNSSDVSHDIYDLIFSEDVQEFFDYLWIWLRIPIFIVSIYVLEML